MEQLDREILALIGQGMDRRDEEQFNRLALDLFEYQFVHNRPYQNFCRRRGVAPAKISSWQEIPAVPTSAFKDAVLACFPIEQSVAVFETSGTTQTVAKRGRHYLQTADLYRASILPNFAAHLLPESVAAGHDRRDVWGVEDGSHGPPLQLPMLMLTPSPEEVPHSSLSHMMGVVAEEFGARGKHYFIREGRLEAARLCDALRMAESFGQDVLLLGTSFAFVHFFEFCEANHQYFRLHEGSRAMETGGFKGKSRETSKEELRQWFEEYLSMPADRVVNEYGMTELGVQFYDVRLRHSALGIRPFGRLTALSEVEGHSAFKSVPPWSRVQIVDPATGKEVEEGGRGLVRVFDLTNRSSVMAIQTEDVGIRIGTEFEVLGRAAGSEARGCSIAADEFLAANEPGTTKPRSPE